MSLLCEACHHPVHAGRCFVVVDNAYCRCKHKEPAP